MSTIRIKEADLKRLVDQLNKVTGNPMETWRKNKEGKGESAIGNYHIDYAYGGVALHQIMGLGGGVNDIFGGHMPKRELYEKIQAYKQGYNVRTLKS